MNENKQLFINEYEQLCKKYNLMLQPDILAALILTEFNKELFNQYIRELTQTEYFNNIKTIIAKF